MKLSYKTNLCGGLLSLIVGGVLMILIPRNIGIEQATSQTYGITSRSVPYAMALLIIVCGLGLIIKSIFLKQDTVKTLVLREELKALIYIGILILYCIFFKYSYMLSTAVLGCLTLALQKCRNVWYYVIVLVAVVALYYIFSMLLRIRMPTLFL